MNKAQRAMPVEAHDAFDNDGNVKALVRIEGLSLYRHDEVTGVNIFELAGLKRRAIDYPAMLDAIGISVDEREEPLVSLLVETIDRAVQDHDLMNLLRKRVKFVG